MIGGIDRDGDRADTGQREGDEHDLRTVRQHDGDVFTRRHPGRRQSLGHAVRLLVHIAEGERGVREFEEQRVVMGLGAPGENIAECRGVRGSFAHLTSRRATGGNPSSRAVECVTGQLRCAS
nr:hypothetical protein [Streptomyces rimosus]